MLSVEIPYAVKIPHDVLKVLAEQGLELDKNGMLRWCEHTHPVLLVDTPDYVKKSLALQGLGVEDASVVHWQQLTKHHPKQRPVARKCYDSALIIFLEFFTTMISNTGSSVADHAQDGLQLSRETALVCFTTVYRLGQTLGGLLSPPICESFGERNIYVGSSFAYAAFCVLIAASPHLPGIITGRFISGMMSAMPGVVAAGSIENMWDCQAWV